MNRTRKLAVAVVAVLGLSGCASTQLAGPAGAQASGAQAQSVEQKVIRALPSYGTIGGYRYRRFAAVAAAS